VNAKRYTLILSVLTSMSAAAEQLPAIVDRDNPTRASRGVIRNQAVLPLKSEAVIVEPTQQPALNLNSMIEVKQLNFRGGSRYRQEELIQPYADLIGKKVSLQQLLQATQRLTGRYKSDGYPLSFAYLPSNNFHQGVVQVVLVEGYLSGLNVNSNNDNIAERIRRLAQPMLAEKTINAGNV
jgi:hemolysin activation/secretion protein